MHAINWFCTYSVAHCASCQVFASLTHHNLSYSCRTRYNTHLFAAETARLVMNHPVDTHAFYVYVWPHDRLVTATWA